VVVRAARGATIAATEGNIRRDIRGKRSPPSADALTSELAARQQGLVTRPQLMALGMGPDAIDRRIATQRLHPVHRGVFAVGHRLRTRESTWMAAVLAAGPDAVLAFRSAPALWGMRQSSRLEVIAPRRHRRPAIETHRIVLLEDEVTFEAGIPVTTPARTLLDLAAVVPEQHLERAFHEAEVRRLTSPTSLDALVARYGGRRGTGAIKQVLARHEAIGQAVPTSILERRFLALLDAHDLPRPRINRITGNGEIDATWPEQRLIVECDGFATHGTRKAFEEDRAKDRALQVAGWRVVRITWRQLIDDPDTIARQIAALLR
jgi:very-short-patch-repair endonuclease